MSDDELFENWWQAHSPPGAFDKAQCKIAFIAGLVTQRAEATQQGARQAADTLPEGEYFVEYVEGDVVRLTPRR